MAESNLEKGLNKIDVAKVTEQVLLPPDSVIELPIPTDLSEPLISTSSPIAIPSDELEELLTPITTDLLLLATEPLPIAIEPSEPLPSAVAFCPIATDSCLLQR